MAEITGNTSIHSGPQRPTLLTVLCILTFIASSWGVMNGIRTYMNANVASAIIDQAMGTARQQVQESAKDDARAGKIAEKIMDGASQLADPVKLKKNALFSILANLLTLGGAWLMFQMRKPGFWVYVAGVAVSVIGPLAVYGTGNLLGLGMTLWVGFFGILFAVLYSLNLKYMA